jgi:hypothetical protein
VVRGGRGRLTWGRRRLRKGSEGVGGLGVDFVYSLFG